MTTRETGGQAPMVLGRFERNNKPEKICSYYLCGKKKAIEEKTAGTIIVDRPSRLNPLVRVRGMLYCLKYN